jgi:hypothetical protein
MKQTAVEWLIEKFMTENTTREGWHEIFEQAKEMEKKQTIDFAWEMSDLTWGEIEEDYNKTFNSEEQ